MAKKKQRTIKASAAPQDAAADDIKIINPDVPIILAGKDVTVREYRFGEGLRIRALAKPLLDDMQVVLNEGRDISAEEYLDILGTHQALVHELISISCDLPVAEIEQLSAREGMDLLDVWWAVNGSFFIRAAMKQVWRARGAAKARAAGQMSGNSSSVTDTAPSNSSNTPSDK